MRVEAVAVCLAIACCPTPAWGFNGHRVTEGPLTVSVDPNVVITAFDRPVAVGVQLENRGKRPLTGVVEVRDLVDEWRVVGSARQTFRVEAGRNQALEFRVAVGKGAHSALYPIHAYASFSDGQAQRVVHAVAIARTQLGRSDASLDEPPPLPALEVPQQGVFPLWRARAYRVVWRYFDKPWVYKPVGWHGSDTRSRAAFDRNESMTRGTVKRAIGMHPPWRPRAGTMFVEYLLRLPTTRPLKLSFANAIRDHASTEPPSDGVTFRVWAVRAGHQQQLFERHTDAKTWSPAEVDLGEFAGQTVLLRLESHPGPKRDTTCDQSFWGEPVVVAGAVPPPLAGADRVVALQQVSRAATLVAGSDALMSGKPLAIKQHVLGPIHLSFTEGFAFRIGSGDDACGVVVRPGKRGLLDGAIGLASARGKAVAYDGLPVEINGEPVGDWASTVSSEGAASAIRDGRLVTTHRLRDRWGPFALTIGMWAEGPGLRIRFDCPGEPADRADPTDPRRITDLSLGPANVKASRVHYGHGYCILEPKAFRAHFGGHNLSTSHVGVDFASGLSVLQAVDHPPDRLIVEPDRRLYALHTHLNATLTLVAGSRGAHDCAVRYRALYDKSAAGGVKRLAGRFTYDIWGGTYAGIAEQMARMARYGCTDAVLTIHNWQRWGYDYRLPDIFPPNPELGSVEDMRRIDRVCRRHDIPWGLHDNYIDFYPDATGYSYDHICFTSGGDPIRAWYNRGRKAQSYRWRPDAFRPFLERNLKLIKEALRPNHYFIDVFTSIGIIDFYDRSGRYHPTLETRRCWGEAFAWIRDHLGDDAPTTSEAGHDQLVGYLDGADCQFLTLSQDPRAVRHMISRPCADWERTPWFDAVLHDKFILHGVGYCTRYRADRPRRLHGIVSDDYVTSEVLTGHPAMIDAGGWGAAAVQKYWLLHDVGRNLALRRIREHRFVDGDIHHQQIAWDNGTTVWVNRGRHDWRVRGRVLPRYGYLVEGDGLRSSIERIDGVIVEQTRGPVGVYCNARTYNADNVLKVRPRAEGIEHIGGRRFRLDLRWDVAQPVPRGLRVFVHFLDERQHNAEKIAFQGDHVPDPPTETWRGVVRSGADQVIEVPRAIGPGRYEVVAGLYNKALGRQALLGTDRGGRRYLLGTLVVEGTKEQITRIRLEPTKPAKHEEEPRTNLERKPIDFGPLVTDGACRVEVTEGGVRVTPLPSSPTFTVRLRPASFGRRRPVAGAEATALDADGKAIRRDTLSATDGVVTLTHDGKAFAYDVRWAAKP